LRIVLTPRNVRGRDAERRERVRLHSAHGATGVCSRTKLRDGPERLRWVGRVRVVHGSSDLRRRWYRGKVRMHSELSRRLGARREL
jgi:hypothetical protein